ncbi:MAG: hypothetical protein FD165_2416 [Gammaproteobacteria bacterium]|nr:MAG: hypothetical protein FD165_2416 [Gammaproteobacteria bacterium]TND03670.1 MAG: hypothetical protein FD120_1826 [Gammaproteobacteria bacterium]
MNNQPGLIHAASATTATLLAALMLPFATVAGADTGATHVIGNFSAGNLADWSEQVFKGHTVYQPATIDGRQALSAVSAASASGLHKKVKIDLAATPYLEWSWRTDDILRGIDETTRAGDDYPLRLYVIFSRGWFFWQTYALCYVWASNKPADAAWPNAYTSNTIQLAVQSGEARLGEWLDYRRDVRADIKRYMGFDVDHIDAVAIMTDTDNSAQRASAWYGDIIFSGN